MLFRNQHPSTDCQYLPFQPPLRFYRIFQIHQEYLQRIPQQDFLSVVDNFSRIFFGNCSYIEGESKAKSKFMDFIWEIWANVVDK